MEANILLNDVKTTVEGLLSMPTANVWSIYGGLKRLSACVENILNHGLKYNQSGASLHQTSSLDYNQFIKSLHWLKPELAPSAEKIRKISHEENISEGRAWVRHSLRSHTMSAQLKALVGDRQNLSNSYNDEAFLCNAGYFQALCICLEAVEKNKPSLLTDIKHDLLKSPSKARAATLPLSPRAEMYQSHRLSEPANPTIDPLTNEITPLPVTLKLSEKQARVVSPTEDKLQYRFSAESSRLDSILNYEEDGEEPQRKPSSQRSSSKVNKGKQPMKGHQRSKSDMSFIKAQQHVKIPELAGSDLTPGRSVSALSSSLPDNESAVEERIRNASFQGRPRGYMMNQSSDCYFPPPSPGESLKSYLSSQDFDTCAELDRENAHFAISEALIAAIEHMKWNQVLMPTPDRLVSGQLLEDSEIEDSDEEINKLKQKVRERRKMKQAKKLLQASDWSSSGATPKSSSHSNSNRDSDSLYSEEDGYSSAYSDTDSLLTLRDGVTVSDRLSDAGLSANHALSADQVALSLLSQFNDYHLPKADQLVWLVSEKEAPQALLPLPDSLPISPDDMTEGRMGTRIRGNAEWAPPRVQIVFNIHSTPGRKILISKQNYRCAGCGMKIEQGYLKRFRYCEYLGKYFCHCCHTNSTSVIPARILHKWDFNKYYVSNFSRDLIIRMSAEPLFNLLDINAGLMRRVSTLQRITLSRLRLRFSRPFLASCRLGTECYANMLQIPSYLMDDVHLYSLNDLLKAKSKDLETSLHFTASSVAKHILECELCKAKGFICEICDNAKDVIFPFQFDRVIRCNHCLSCFHTNCFTKRSRICPKCIRVETRRQSQVTALPNDADADANS